MFTNHGVNETVPVWPHNLEQWLNEGADCCYGANDGKALAHAGLADNLDEGGPDANGYKWSEKASQAIDVEKVGVAGCQHDRLFLEKNHYMDRKLSKFLNIYIFGIYISAFETLSHFVHVEYWHDTSAPRWTKQEMITMNRSSNFSTLDSSGNTTQRATMLKARVTEEYVEYLKEKNNKLYLEAQNYIGYHKNWPQIKFVRIEPLKPDPDVAVVNLATAQADKEDAK
jgi:hypothetical protein